MNLRGAGVAARQRKHNERGASAVEAAIVTPMVFALFFGILEMGFLFKDYLAVAGAVRAGVRMASANPRTSTFAQDAADSVARLGGAMNLNDIQQLWVYQLDRNNLLSDKPVGYSSFSGCSVCVKFKWDPSAKKFVSFSDTWSADTQNACSTGYGGPPDRVGVYINLKHDGFTKFVFTTVNVSEASSMRFEPMPYVGGCKPLT
jgi:TadE-like protein